MREPRVVPTAKNWSLLAARGLDLLRGALANLIRFTVHGMIFKIIGANGLNVRANLKRNLNDLKSLYAAIHPGSRA